jgi:hypothetical protein
VNTQDFLATVWPQTGVYLTIIPATYTDRSTTKQVPYFKHFADSTIEAAAARAAGLAAQGNDVFFALGSVKEDLTTLNKTAREAAGKKVRGRHKTGHNNTAFIRSFWLDLDVDAAKAAKGENAYATRDEALASLRSFVQQMNMPVPLVTSSGGGYHAYWPLTCEMQAEKWEHYADLFKQLTTAWGMKADPSRTSDQASILRPVGTFNMKTGTPRPVEVVVYGQPSDTDQFLKHIEALAARAQLQPTPVRGPSAISILGAPPPHIAGVAPVVTIDVSALNEAAAHGAAYDQPDPRLVVGACLQLAWQASNQGLVSEPQWYAMIGCLRHAKDGIRAVHFMSRQSPTYDPATTDAKIQQHIDGNYGPTTCAKFESSRPGGCTQCPFRGKITTPLQNVKELKQAAPPMVSLSTAQGTVQIALPPPPKPYKRVTNPLTGTNRIAMTIGDMKTGSTEDIVIYEHDIYPSKLIKDERLNEYVAVINRWLPHEGWEEFELPLSMLYDTKNWSKSLGSFGVLVDVAHIGELVQYMIGYMRDLQKAAQANVIYAQLGWHKDQVKFVLPDRVVTPAGVQKVTPSKNVANSLSWVEAKGDLEIWKQIAAVYDRPGLEAHQFGFGVGFASPLFKFTNFNGMLVSMVGERGAGKSSAAMMANSIWGHPTMGWADAKHDTQKAFYQKLGILKNLPVTYDEHTNLDNETVSDMAYSVSKGQGRQRLQQNAQAAENFGNWQLMMLMTGNKSLNDRLGQLKGDSSAESARIFEYVVPANTLAKAEADKYWGPNSLISQHYGMAGEVYAQQLVASESWARHRVAEWVQIVDAQASVSSGERFWSAGVACVLTGFELANACGLTNVNIQRLLKFACSVILEMRGTVTENTREAESILADYLNNSLGATLILNSDATPTANAMMLHEPASGRGLHIRMEKHHSRMYLDRADFRKFAMLRGVDVSALTRQMLADKILLNKNYRMTLGKGTKYGGIQTVCWVIDTSHPSLLGVGDMAVVQTQQAPAHLRAVP